MKKTFLLFCLALFCSVSFAEAQTADTNKITIAEAEKIYGKQIIAYKDSLTECKSTPYGGKEVSGFWLWLLILSPLIAYCTIAIITMKYFDLRKALQENIPQMKTIENPIFKKENSATLIEMLKNPANASNLVPTIQISNYDVAVPSSSRYAALITVFFGLAVVAVFISIYSYTFFACSKPIDLNHLNDIFIALLVGIAPYGFNRLGAGIKGKD